MTKTLTEQWRDGTLPEGYYYITSKKWGMLIDRYRDQINDCGDEWRGFDNCQGIVDEVLAPVPSYDEYKELLRHSELSRNLVYEVLVNQKEYNELLDKAKENKRLQERLAIATKALKEYADSSNWYETDDFGISAVDQFACDDYGYNIAKEALEEMEGVK